MTAAALLCALSGTIALLSGSVWAGVAVFVVGAALVWP